MSSDLNAERYWACWLDEVDPSVERLRSYTLTVAHAAKVAGQSEDLARLRELLDLYEAGANLFTEEPLLTPYENGRFHICLVIADASILSGNPAQGFKVARLVNEGLKDLEARRSSLGLVQTPNSELKVSAIGIMASSFFEDTSLCSPDVMVSLEQEFRYASLVFWRNLDNPTVREDVRTAMHHLIAIWELEVCKACLVLTGGLAHESAVRFNARHGDHLNCGPPNGQAEPAIHQSAWFWDYEYAKLSLSRDDYDDLNYCAQMRLAAARLTFGAQALAPLSAHWEARHRQQLLKARSRPANSQDRH